ncbi:MAG: NUDIX domain-containing protein [Candidatus Acidiferrales bacterium]
MRTACGFQNRIAQSHEFSFNRISDSKRPPGVQVPRRSAGILMYRKKGKVVKVFLAHPGGPFWSKKEAGAWTMPKGEFEPGEEPLAAAVREFQEETGFAVAGEFLDLGTVKQRSGKMVYAWAVEGNCDASALVSNTCEIEWPPRSGRKIEIPEVDRGGWFSMADAREKIMIEQLPFLDALAKKLEK